MVLRRLLVVVWVTLALALQAATAAAGKQGDWEYRVDRDNGESVGKSASTQALSQAGGAPMPNLVIRRAQSDDDIELLVTATHDTAADECEYKDWKLSIDSTEIRVLGYTFEPAKTELKTKLGTAPEDFWSLFRKGYKLSVSAEQKCASKFGEPNPISLDFSLRGSSAVYMFVSSDAQ